MHRKLRYLAVTIGLGTCSLLLQAANPATPAHGTDTRVSAVAGESWLHYLHRSFGDTSMGKTGRLGPPAPEPGQQVATWRPASLAGLSNQNVVLHGSDLYRLNCQGCHGDAGLGAPPEIHSVIDPVRATSAALVMQKMKKAGMEISAGAAAELARQAQQALSQRFRQGGQAMPSFAYLDEAEIRALTAYLRQLAGVPGAAQLAVRESPVRVGELIAKSTCHICHDAAGANPNAQELENGAIPPLQTLPTRADQVQFIRKVTSGAPITMGTPPTAHRGRMPVFYYLSDDEAADVYLYLTTYPPSQLAESEPVLAVSQSRPGGGSGMATPSGKPSGAEQPARTLPAVSDGPSLTLTMLLVGLGLALLALAAAGFGFTVHELRRLANRAESHRMQQRTSHELEKELLIPAAR